MNRSKDKRVRRKPRRKKYDEGERPPETVGSFFLDSGAHSLFNIHAHQVAQHRRYAYFRTSDFRRYIDDYCAFIKQYSNAIDYYVNVDVIHHPKLSWKVLKYIEKEHGLTPVPVIHMGASLNVLDRHLDAGYEYIGLGGVALEGTRTSYLHWADKMFKRICDTPSGKPCVRVHGFAMTAWKSLIRYPWWSVDSASWAKAGGFGMVYFPKMVKGKFVFVPPNTSAVSRYEPYNLSCSANAPAATKGYQSILAVPRKAQEVMVQWLTEIGVPMGKVFMNPDICQGWHNSDYFVPHEDPAMHGEMIDWGVVSHHAARKIANLRFFKRLVDELPEWPWRFAATASPDFGLLSGRDNRPRERLGEWGGDRDEVMKFLYYSGSTSGMSLPERVLETYRPGVMLTYWEMREKRGDTVRRFERHVSRREELQRESES